jgi:lactate dehydrogenase-like 2-hydroxyacid dehydrogenase/phosphoserine aminotransferase
MTIEQLKAERQSALEASRLGPPRRTGNPFFGVGPITDAAADEADSRLQRFAFDHWLEENYRKLDDRGRDLGPFTTAETARSMHRGYPADKFLLDMMREIHRYFGFPKPNRMAVGLGGGHSGFTVAALHLIDAHDAGQHIFIDTPAPESESAKAGGFFRQSWGAQIVEMMRQSKKGDETRLHFAGNEGHIPPAAELERLGVKLVFGVGHETTGATTYSSTDIANLLEWLRRNPRDHHAVLDATSMLGAMPWGEEVVAEVMAKCCLFMPFQKAIGGISGYFLVSFTPAALARAETNQKNPSWAIPRQLKPLAFAETTFGLLRAAQRVGDVHALNRRSVKNRDAVNDWIKGNDILRLGVEDEERRGAAVTLLRIDDKGITDAALHARIIARSKQLLAYEGITHPNGVHEEGLDVARYVNAFPGTPGDYRAWIGGIRDTGSVTALLENLRYAYLRAKVVVLEEELAKQGVSFPADPAAGGDVRHDDPEAAYAVLICDLVGLKFAADGRPDPSAVKAHIEAKGGVFHLGPLKDRNALAKGRIHFFYQPDLSTEAEILPQTEDGRYDAVIAAATFLPKAARFRLGGVRIGAGTGNMACACWGGGNGEGGEAVLMNTPSFNSRATAHMAIKALLKVMPDLPVDHLHARVVAGDFDTGRDLRDYPTEKLEGKTIAVLGFGNIGREVAKLAAAFGMKVRVYSREKQRPWVESEGFEWAATAEDAASGADVVSPHTGLGALDAATHRYANAGVIGASVLAALNDGAVVVNYDRGECVDAEALDAAMASGKVRYAAIDADLFKDATTGKLSGPMVPFLPLAAKYPGRLELLPHAAADTEHLSRVAGAKQAVDQIFDLIRYRRVTNRKGSLSEGYSDAGALTVSAVGRVTSGDFRRAVSNREAVQDARATAETMAAIWGALSSITGEDRLEEIISRHGPALVMAFNRHAALMRKLGLEGPYG